MVAPVVVAGTIATDLIGRVEAFPDDDVVVALRSLRRLPGGCAANVALRLAALDVPVGVWACVGDDADGAMLLDRLARAGVDTSDVVLSSEPTSTAFIVTDAEGAQRTFFHRGADRDLSSLESGDARPDLGLFVAGDLAAFPDLMSRCGRVVFNPGQETFHNAPRRVDLCIEHADIVCGNRHEIERLGGTKALLDRRPVAVVETRGADGSLVHEGGAPLSVRALPAAVVDPTGAGDAVAAGVLAGLFWDWPLRRAVRFGHVLAAAAIAGVGAQANVLRLDEARSAYEAAWGPWPDR